jgi:hypothetical protein
MWPPMNNWEWLSFWWCLVGLGLVAWGWWYTRRFQPKRPPGHVAQQMRMRRRA